MTPDPTPAAVSSRRWTPASLAGRAGTVIEGLLDDRAWLQAMLDARPLWSERRPGSARSPGPQPTRSPEAATPDDFDLVDLARRSVTPPPLRVRWSRTSPPPSPRPHRMPPTSCTAARPARTSSTPADAGRRPRLKVIEPTSAPGRRLAALAERHRDTPMPAVPHQHGRSDHVRAEGGGLAPARAGRAAARCPCARRAADPARRVRPAPWPATPVRAAGQRHGEDPDFAAAYSDWLVTAFAEETWTRRTGTALGHTLRTPIADLGAVLGSSAAHSARRVDIHSMTRTETAEVVGTSRLGAGACPRRMPHKR